MRAHPGGGSARPHRRRTLWLFQPNYEWITWSRVRVLRGPAEFRTEREIAAELGISYDGVRSIVEDIKRYTGLGKVREIGRWWVSEWPKWLKWAAEQGGLREERGGS